MDVINTIPGITLSKTGNLKDYKTTGLVGADKYGNAVEYKIDYPGGSFTGTNYEIQDFFMSKQSGDRFSSC